MFLSLLLAIQQPDVIQDNCCKEVEGSPFVWAEVLDLHEDQQEAILLHVVEFDALELETVEYVLNKKFEVFDEFIFPNRGMSLIPSDHLLESFIIYIRHKSIIGLKL